MAKNNKNILEFVMLQDIPLNIIIQKPNFKA